MSTRLNNAIREGIRDALLDRRFAKREADLLTREHALGLRVYATQFTPEYLAWLEAEPGKPEVFTTSQISFQSRAGGRRSLELEPPCRTRNAPYWWGVSVDSTVPEDLDAAVCDHWSEKEALKVERRGERERLDGLLSVFTSTKKLVEAWPELRTVVDKVVGTATTSMDLAVIPADLNTLYDLPPEDIAA